MIFVPVTHATTGTKVDIVVGKIFGLAYSENLGHTIIISGEGGQYPVKEDKKEILALIRKNKLTYVGGKE